MKISDISNNRWYDKTRHLRRDAFIQNYPLLKEKVEKSDDTKMRLSIMKEIEEEVAKGRDIDSIVEEIASREEVKEAFSYYAKNGITRPLSEIIKGWYTSKQNNRNNEFNRSIY